MVNRTCKILLIILLVGTVINLGAQQRSKGKTEPKEPANTNTRHYLLPTVYLGRSEYKGGTITKNEFDRLLKQGLTSRDSLGNKYKVMGFDFNYIERELYEDSAGNLKVMTEIFYEYCAGDTVSGNVANSIYDRSKPGDTVLIDRVKVAKYLNKNMKAIDTQVIAGKNLKLVIVK